MFIDHLAQLLEGLRSVSARLDTHQQTTLNNIVAQLSEAAIDLDAATPKRFPKRMKHTGPPVKWVCCKQPTKHRTRKGKYVWMAWCKWKKGGKTGGMMRVLGDAKNPKPKKPLGIRTC